MNDDADHALEKVQHEFLVLLNELRKFRGDEPLTAMPEAPFCNFCGKSKAEVRAMVEGIDAHICDACVGEAYRLFRVG